MAVPCVGGTYKNPPARGTSWPTGIPPACPALTPCHPHLLSFQWWQVEKVNPIKLYEENKVIAGFSLLNLLFKQGRAGLIRGVVDKLIALYNQKKIKPVVDSLWALEEVRMMFPPADSLFLLILADLGSQIQSFIKGFLPPPPGLFVLNEDPKCHCPRVWSAMNVRYTSSFIVVLKPRVSICLLCHGPFPVGHWTLMGMYDSPGLQESVYIVATSITSSLAGIWDRGQSRQWLRAEIICVPSRVLGSPSRCR